MPRRYLFALLATSPLLSCTGVQSALHSKGEHAARIAEVSWVMFIGGGLIFVAVMICVAIALFGSPAMRSAIGRHSLILAAGIAFPVIVLSALLVYAMVSSSSLVGAAGPPAMRIEVVGELWWWRVRYIDQAGTPIVETANEIRIPAGRPVALSLTTADVIHSFWVPNLAGKIDMIPGHVNKLRLQADNPGTFRGQCAEYCGAQHANMAFHVVALAPEDFDAWLTAQKRPAQAPSDPLLLRGRDVFLANGCAQCHAIKGTPAAGTAGPDLTHAGSRMSLAAGALPNSVGAFAGWIAASQHLKPGNKMPSFDRLSSEDLRAIAAYMESLQ